jgi:AmiR/NasT family two-component response regulator
MEYKNIIICFIFTFYLSSLYCQDLNELYILYNNRQIRELKNKVDLLEKKYPDKKEILFFKTLFIRNGDEAVQNYQNLLGQADEKLKAYVVNKISEYYYAKGYYVTALQYQDDIIVTSNQNVKENIEEKNQQLKINENSKFKIQLGAFSVKENANQLIEKLLHNGIHALIVERMVNDILLYCVWINGKNSFEETKLFAEMIKKKFQLEYRIIKP